MKKITILFLCFLVIASVSMAARIEKVYTFGDYTVNHQGDYQTLSFNKLLLTGLPGEPILAYQQVKILLPPGESVDRIEFVGSDLTEIPGSFRISPQQQVQPISKGTSGVFIKNEQVYQSGAVYPASISGHVMTSFLNGHAFALSSFTPMQYIPATGNLSYYQKVKVIVYTKPTSEATAALKNLRQTAEISAELNRFADNPEMMDSYVADNSTASDNYDILVITTPAFAGSFTSMSAAYLKEGLLTQVVTTDLINQSMTGQDLQEKMRNFIIQEYQQHGIRHVVLGGDDELIPHRGFYCFVQSSSVYEDSNIPSDLYFSALDGNWNTDGDNMWAEPGEDDLLPDISVGRLSFSNQQELQHMLHKSEAYQFTPVAGEFQKVLIAGEFLYSNPDTYGSDYLELIIGAQSENGYTTIGIPGGYTYNKMYDEIANWTGSDLIASLNQGYPMLHHCGHANETYVMRLSNGDITDNNFNNLNGVVHNYPLVYTHGCLCGAFDYPYDDCIAEKMVSINNFASAFVGNSRYGWFNEGQTEGPSAHLHREFVDAIFTDKLNRLGRAHMESKIATAPWVTAPGQWEPGAIRWCFYDCNVLGDPAMAIWANNSITINTVYPSNIAVGATGMQVNVTSAGFSVSGLTCVLLMNGTMLGKATTNDQGNAAVVFDAPVANAGDAQLIVSGYNCLPVAYPVTVTGNTGINTVEVNPLQLVIAGSAVTGQIRLNYEHPTAEVVTIYLTAADGKTILMKPSGSEEAGSHSLVYDATSLAAGVYQCTLLAGNHLVSARFVKK